MSRLSRRFPGCFFVNSPVVKNSVKDRDAAKTWRAVPRAAFCQRPRPRSGDRPSRLRIRMIWFRLALPLPCWAGSKTMARNPAKDTHMVCASGPAAFADGHCGVLGGVRQATPVRCACISCQFPDDRFQTKELATSYAGNLPLPGAEHRRPGDRDRHQGGDLSDAFNKIRDGTPQSDQRIRSVARPEPMRPYPARTEPWRREDSGYDNRV